MPLPTTPRSILGALADCVALAAAPLALAVLEPVAEPEAEPEAEPPDDDAEPVPDAAAAVERPLAAPGWF